MSETPTSEGLSRGRLIGSVGAGLAVVALVAVMAVGLLNQGRSANIVAAIAANERPEAPDLELPVLVGGGGLEEGEIVRLSELRGQPILLNFWASWCPPCRDEAPVLEAIWQRYRERGLLVLGVDSQDLSANAREFHEEFKLTYPSVRDGGDSTMRTFEVFRLPETFVIDSQGRIAAKHPGQISSVEQLAAPIEAGLGSSSAP